jgi:predicted SAM-dependent methyltransferase
MKFQGFEIDRLNIGCGKNFVPGWLNIGLFPQETIPYGTIAVQGQSKILNWDMTKDMVLPGNSIKHIFASHFIEHLTFYDAINFYKRCYEILEPGGIVRFSCPDLGLWIKNYTKGNTKFFNQYKDTYFGDKGNNIAFTKGQIFMGSLFLWNHKWAYDFESLKEVLERVGFRSIKKHSLHKGEMPELKKIEPKERQFESLYVEAKKGE